VSQFKAAEIGGQFKPSADSTPIPSVPAITGMCNTSIDYCGIPVTHLKNFRGIREKTRNNCPSVGCEFD
jgi:hypothetical protein